MGRLQPSDWPARAWVASPSLPNTTDVSHWEHGLVLERPKETRASQAWARPHTSCLPRVWRLAFLALEFCRLPPRPAHSICPFSASLPLTDGERIPRSLLDSWQKLSVQSPGFLSPLTSLASTLQPQLYGTNTGVTYILHWTPSPGVRSLETAHFFSGPLFYCSPHPFHTPQKRLTTLHKPQSFSFINFPPPDHKRFRLIAENVDNAENFNHC